MNQITYDGTNAVDVLEFIEGDRFEGYADLNGQKFYYTPEYRGRLEIGIGDTVVRNGSWFKVEKSEQ